MLILLMTITSVTKSGLFVRCNQFRSFLLRLGFSMSSSSLLYSETWHSMILYFLDVEQ